MKTETLEEAAERILIDTLIDGNNSFDLELDSKIKEDVINAMIKLAKWQQEKSYSEEDMDNYAEYCTSHVLKSQVGHPYLSVTKWFEQFKKK